MTDAESEAQARLLLDSTGVAMYAIDLEDNCTFANAACLRMLGYRDFPDLARRKMHESIPHTRPDGTPHSLENCRLFQAGVKGEELSGEDEIFWRTDGTGFFAEYRAFPVSQGGTRVGSVVTFVDITRRKQAEDALRRSSEQLRNSGILFRALIEKSKDAIAMAAADGTILYMSPEGARISGYTPDDMVGTNVATWVHPEDRDRFLAMLLSAGRDAHTTRPFEYRRIHRDGSVRWIEGTATNLLDDPAVGAIVGNFRDVTQRKRGEEALRRAEEQLRQSQKMEAIGRLAGGVAHDFNNLLSVILSYSEFLLEGAEPADAVRADLEEIKAAGMRACDLTRQLLAFSRNQALQPKVVDLNGVVAAMEGLLRPLIGEDVELAVVRSAAPAKVDVDRGQIEQVVMNLVVNSRDAMPRGGKLTIEIGQVLRPDDETTEDDLAGTRRVPQVLLAVRDTGTGMDDATRRRVFEPFFTTKEAGKGTGLGLSTVFGIVKQSGGTVSVDSEPGHGATFRIYLPAVESDVAVEPKLPAMERRPSHGRSETILVVDDDEHVRKVAAAILGRAGYRVLEARSGGDALVICEQHVSPIDLLITDIVMPYMSGDRLAARLLSTRPGMKVLCISGYPDQSLPQKGPLPPDFAFMQKPITPETLIAKVEEVLARRAPGETPPASP